MHIIKTLIKFTITGSPLLFAIDLGSLLNLSLSLADLSGLSFLVASSALHRETAGNLIIVGGECAGALLSGGTTSDSYTCTCAVCNLKKQVDLGNYK